MTNIKSCARKCRWRKLLSDERGTSAILFALLAMPVFCLGLAGIDYARARNTKVAMQAAIDNASIAGAKMLGKPHNDVESAVKGYLAANLPGNTAELPFELVFAPEDTALTLSMKTSVPTAILGIVGVPSMPISASATADRPVIHIKSPQHRSVSPEHESDRPTLPQERSSQIRAVEDIARELKSAIEHGEGPNELRRILRQLNRAP